MGETFFANMTFVRPFRTVHFYVRIQQSWVDKSFAAMFAGPRFLTGVCSRVNAQRMWIVISARINAIVIQVFLLNEKYTHFLPHTLHSCFFSRSSPVWQRKCRVNELFSGKPLPQTPHLCGFSSKWMRTCRFNWMPAVKKYEWNVENFPETNWAY